MTPLESLAVTTGALATFLVSVRFLARRAYAGVDVPLCTTPLSTGTCGRPGTRHGSRVICAACVRDGRW